MNKNVLKPIIGGVVLGAIVFFTGPLLLIVLLLKFIFTPFGMGRMMMQHRFAGPMGFNPKMQISMADKIRNMSDEEFTSLKKEMNYKFNCNKNINQSKEINEK
ncbi:MAG: hypothetical protein IPP08_11215 [Chlorobiota bacterium]|jgi:hypothetical protein|nr:hypothetical protein [Chlorobiota bacterium]QQS66319.1 MAG: hypothetical protein IPP08_11215 [Chlorobiota bacterium]